MAFKNETPLRGWKEIMEFTRIDDRRFARRILYVEKKVVSYEGRQPVMLVSEYLLTLKKQ